MGILNRGDEVIVNLAKRMEMMEMALVNICFQERNITMKA